MNKEEAIKVLNARPYTGEVREALETLIPELRESEDERIRKGLIEALKTSKTVGELKFILPEPTREDCLAWLEKQKEQKPFWNPTEEDVVLFNKAITTNMTLTPQERAKLDIIRMKFKHCPYIEQKEQQPAEWSEEDEDYYDTIVCKLEIIGDDSGLSNNQIKFLREHCPSQCSNKWSEGDEHNLNNILYILNQLKDTANPEDKTAERCITWLKSLRPSWKPSVEQMNTLLSVEGILRSLRHDDKAKILASIYEQLKKLM